MVTASLVKVFSCLVHAWIATSKLLGIFVTCKMTNVLLQDVLETYDGHEVHRDCSSCY